MRKIIHRIKQKSEEERRHILHITVFILALFLIALWIFSLGRTITNKDTTIKVNQDLKPFSVLKDNLVGGFKQ
jgi:hypothetical protein